MSSLLPPNATPLERAAAEALAQIQRVPVPLRTLWNPDTCPEHLLPYLAWTFSVDRWDPLWPATTKRAVIKRAFYVHQRKGTIAALRRVVEPFGYLFKVVEWWQTEPNGTPGTFRLDINLLDAGITEQAFAELERLIAEAKPLTRHMAMILSGLVGAMPRVAAVTTSGEGTSIYPMRETEVQQFGSYAVLAAEYTADTVTIYSQ